MYLILRGLGVIEDMRRAFDQPKVSTTMAAISRFITRESNTYRRGELTRESLTIIFRNASSVEYSLKYRRDYRRTHRHQQLRIKRCSATREIGAV